MRFATMMHSLSGDGLKQGLASDGGQTAVEAACAQAITAFGRVKDSASAQATTLEDMKNLLESCDRSIAEFKATVYKGIHSRYQTYMHIHYKQLSYLFYTF